MNQKRGRHVKIVSVLNSYVFSIDTSARYFADARNLGRVSIRLCCKDRRQRFQAIEVKHPPWFEFSLLLRGDVDTTNRDLISTVAPSSAHYQ
ncbi:hypothetical protein C1X21_22120 [Pseudomonas sp. FW305-3-2-15-A-LB2]|nr:hypothetical protein C1X17_21445 [Pseudomonas sp. FW305-3-2-15-C-TSA2]PMV25060.1 hypothetical protein C1X22_20320 [Pseudomonas sp. DP16D-L5]PMV36759.1 hypothetical protein C1X21_22120 [Pseudomonas sp. FW305-3-2-15-A-LB2]PMV42958.1 hypothetical protein C1X16_22245 [Pseudomonas sp. FW305-3-2-15-C-R2A1]PMV48432.1 hypothetical protein C1X18_20470 [Pseudomonas sp. FW305-3-2-15-C-LB1]PMV53237.1 hypothetical protein C1X19_21345 [Pseudomonas sp. GW460-4]PMV60709.1 hypothetical protein C1X20_21325 